MMATKRKSSNRLIVYILIIAAVIILVAWLSGGRSFNGAMHRNQTLVVSTWNWVHILVSLVIGFILGIVFSRRK